MQLTRFDCTFTVVMLAYYSYWFYVVEHVYRNVMYQLGKKANKKVFKTLLSTRHS